MNNKILTIAMIVVFLVIIATWIMMFSKSEEKINLSPKTITLTEYETAYSLESNRIFLLDRKLNEIKYILSDTLSAAIFSIVSNNLGKDYNKTIKN